MARYGMVVNLARCSGCQTCTVACQMQHNTRSGISWLQVDSVEMGRWPDVDHTALPHACLHCEDAPCVAACPTGATTQREDGIVVVDYEKCIACGACMTACPYGARKLNNVEGWYYDAEEPAPYESYGVQRSNVVEKCTFCAERLEAGELPYCVDMCPNAARVFGDLDDPDSEINAYIAKTGAEQVPGAAFYYVKGGHDFDPQQTLMDIAAEAGKDE